eukprot:Blabericola_migrator_1__1222@NODE_1313_length_4837_cov_257_204193_g883_i0_p3_GENE_NODE_1313_length_4837_cov_257_204193_g883_i0NODE_1313_length_4837_cov_257_204193_g883_i0_p3_ORF_typecomplete_len188_score28_82DOT1/PF08123_13/1_8e09Methyltransf_31/PF13847_6/9_1e08MetW/PF07021_12/5_2e05tRNA_U5meth_tr/PF05958_11/0_002Methyltransf_23/PF13489_6/0_0028Methyltransf_11/PF08241_12/0_0079Methyltransf_25/PF13649_6/0_0096Methyltransf_4/PF02390_17/0_038Methyltransf_18/PF12847_7/0_066RrnaAD/PF00398_20/0_1Methy
MEQIYLDNIDEGVEDNFPLWIEGIDTTFAPFVVTPLRLVYEALKLARAGPEDCLIDLGCGDGRFCGVAINPPFCVKEAWGIEVDDGALQKAYEAKAKLSCQSVKFDKINFDDDAFLNMLVQDKQWTLMVVVLTIDFQKSKSQFLRQWLEASNRRRCVSVFFNLHGIDGVECIASTEKCYVYAATKCR